MSDASDRASEHVDVPSQANPMTNGHQATFSTTPMLLQKAPSRTRDHLANERTYLAWMRTAIALMGFGVLIARLRYLLSPDMPGTGHGWALGLMFALIGLATVALSTQHYFSIRTAINAEDYEPADRWVILFSLVLLLLGGGVIYVLFSMPDQLRLLPFQ